jgi:hypothetical protein
MDELTLILSAIAAIASVISVILVIKNNRDTKKHMQNRLDAIKDVYEGPFGYQREFADKNKIEVEKKTLEKDLKIKHKPNNKFDW